MSTIVGHRGAAGLAPENTLPSFRKSLEVGVPFVELDVRLTRDGVPVCFHDDRLDRVTPERGAVGEWEWEQLQYVPVLPGAFQGAYPEARIPSLEQVLRGLPTDCRFLVELKPEAERAEELVRLTRELLVVTGALGRCRWISFDHDLLCRVRTQLVELPEYTATRPLPLGVLVSERHLDRLLPVASELQADAVHIPHAAVNAAFLRSARDAGFLVSAWTVNTPEEVRRLTALGVDEITSDYPDMALAASTS